MQKKERTGKLHPTPGHQVKPTSKAPTDGKMVAVRPQGHIAAYVEFLSFSFRDQFKFLLLRNNQGSGSGFRENKRIQSEL